MPPPSFKRLRLISDSSDDDAETASRVDAENGTHEQDDVDSSIPSQAIRSEISRPSDEPSSSRSVTHVSASTSTFRRRPWFAKVPTQPLATPVGLQPYDWAQYQKTALALQGAALGVQELPLLCISGCTGLWAERFVFKVSLFLESHSQTPRFGYQEL